MFYVSNNYNMTNDGLIIKNIYSDNNNHTDTGMFSFEINSNIKNLYNTNLVVIDLNIYTNLSKVINIISSINIELYNEINDIINYDSSNNSFYFEQISDKIIINVLNKLAIFIYRYMNLNGYLMNKTYKVDGSYIDHHIWII